MNLTPQDSLREVLGNATPGDEFVLPSGHYDKDGDLRLGSDRGRLSGVTLRGATGDDFGGSHIHADSLELRNVAECLISRLSIVAPMRFTGSNAGRNMHGFRLENTWHRSPTGYQILLDGSDGDPDYAMEHFTFDTITFDHTAGARYGLIVNSRNADCLIVRNSRLFAPFTPVLVANGNTIFDGGGCGALRSGPSMWLLGSMDSHVVSGVKFEPQGHGEGLHVGNHIEGPAVSVQGCDLKAPGGRYAFRQHHGTVAMGGCYVGHHGGGSGAVRIAAPDGSILNYVSTGPVEIE